MAELTFTQEDGIGTITFNRPEKRNAFTGEMRQTLHSMLRSPEAQELAVIVLRAEGKMFCAGADLNEVANSNLRHLSSSVDFWSGFRLSRPVLISAVNGIALGLGSGIAMSSDIVIADEEAQFGYPEINHGLVASYMAVGLQALIGARKAFELVITGRRIPAQEALTLGMINEVVPNPKLYDRAYELAREIAGRMPVAVHTTKKFFYEAAEMPFTTGIRASERVVEMMRKNKDVQEKARAFVGRNKTSAEAKS